MWQFLGFPIVANDYLFQAVQALGTIAGVLIPITGMMIAHRKSINDRIDMLQISLNKRVEELMHTMADHELDDERRFGEVRSEIDSAGDAIRRDLGETAAAIREHVHQMQLTSKDNILQFEQKLSETRHTLYGRIDIKGSELDEKIATVSERVRQMEIGRRGGH